MLPVPLHRIDWSTGFRRWALVIVLGGLLVVPMACETLTASNDAMAKDVLAIRNKLDKWIEEQASSNRQNTQVLNSIYDNLQGRNDAVKTSLEDLEKRNRDLVSEIDKLNAKVEELTFAVDTVSKTMNIRTNPMDIGTTATSPAAPGVGPGGVTPAPGNAAEQAYNNATELFNAGDYAKALEAYNQALSLNPEGALKLDVLYQIAECQYKLNDLAKAKTSYWTVITTNNGDLKAWQSLERIADIELSQGDLLNALIHLQQIETEYKNYQNIEAVRAKIAQIKSKSGGAPGGGAPGGGATPAPGPPATPPAAAPAPGAAPAR
ncbi:MAG: tetratricopeptide repeat protein [bacterium]|nr:tetratricopeptide repeat protein [bacterium]